MDGGRVVVEEPAVALGGEAHLGIDRHRVDLRLAGGHQAEVPLPVALLQGRRVLRGRDLGRDVLAAAVAIGDPRGHRLVVVRDEGNLTARPDGAEPDGAGEADRHQAVDQQGADKGARG